VLRVELKREVLETHLIRQNCSRRSWLTASGFPAAICLPSAAEGSNLPCYAAALHRVLQLFIRRLVPDPGR
jgi:hypothetical protein